MITQLGICKVKIKHNNKDKICNFFVIPRNGQSLLGMLNLKKLYIITVNCNTIDTQKTDRADKYNTNTDNCLEWRCKQN